MVKEKRRGSLFGGCILLIVCCFVGAGLLTGGIGGGISFGFIGYLLLTIFLGWLFLNHFDSIMLGGIGGVFILICLVVAYLSYSTWGWGL